MAYNISEVIAVWKKGVIQAVPTLVFAVLAVKHGWPIAVVLVALVPAMAICLSTGRFELPTRLRITLVLFGNYLTTVLAALLRYGNLEMVPLGWLPMCVFAVLIPMLWLGRTEVPED